MNPPTVEFVMDALRVARAANETLRNGALVSDYLAAWKAFENTFDAPMLIALMEDWLRLREALEFYAPESNYETLLLGRFGLGVTIKGTVCVDRGAKARAALAKQGNKETK